MRLIAMALLFLTACTTQKISDRKPQALPPSLAPHRVDANWASDFSFKQLSSIVKQNQAPTTLAGFLAEVRKRHATYLDSYTLMYDSLSLHEASFQNPRAIVFGETARLILTFNGNPKQNGYAALETMEYDLDKGFLFRELAFVKEGGSMDKEEIDPQLSTPNILVSKANPQKCQQCHGEVNTRPIWENYPLWPGAYGADDDNLFAWKPIGKMPSVSRTAKLVGSDVEMSEIKKFIAGEKQSNPRYKVLGNYIEIVSNKSQAIPKGLVDNLQYPEGIFPVPRPNSKLQTRLFEMAAREQVRSLAGNPNFLKWRYAIADGVNVEFGFEKYLPEKFLKDRAEFEFPASREEIDEWTRSSIQNQYEQVIRFDRLLKGHTDIQKPYLSLNDINGLIAIRRNDVPPQQLGVGTMVGDLEEKRIQYILRSLGHDASDWATNLRRAPFIRDGDARKAFAIQAVLYFAEIFPNERWENMRAFAPGELPENGTLQKKSVSLLSSP